MKITQLNRHKAREIIISILLLFLTLSSSRVYAEGQDIWQVRDVTLMNGLRVLLLEDHRTPTATLQVWYRVGSRNECLGMTGISHMLEHMMFRGAKKYGPGAFSEIVEKNGGT